MPARTTTRDTAPSATTGRIEGRLESSYALGTDAYQPDSSRRVPSDARWQPRRDPAPPARRPRRTRSPRSGMVTAKVLLAVVSVLVLAFTGYYWSTLNEWAEGMTTADVISNDPGERPADGAIDIMMVGMDSRTDAQGRPLSKEQLRELSAGRVDGTLNTDTLIMIRIPNDGGRAFGVSIPRDAYVDIPDYGKHKINSAYVRAKNTAAERLRREGVGDQAQVEVRSNQEGAKSLIGTVEQLTGATIDHYAEVNLLGFYDITNAIGGIDVCLKEPVDENLSGAHFPAGSQTLAGAPALAFVRQRHELPNGDLDRIVRQQVFMSGMAKKVFSRDVLTPGSDTLNKLREAVQKSVVLDKDWNVVQFAQQMMGFTGGNVEFTTIPHGSIALQTSGDGDAVEVNPRQVKSFVQGLLDGNTEPSAEQETGDTNESVTVDVRNASSRNGLASTVSKSLVEKGFRAGETGNASARATSVVRFATGEQTNGERVASAVGGDIPVEPDSNVAKGHVTVLLGKDFDANRGDQFAGDRLLTLHAPGATDGLGVQQPAGPDGNGCVN